MRRRPGARVMQAFTALTVLTMANGQTTCNQNMGRVMYERLPNQQLHRYDDDVVRDTLEPLRVLEKCQDLCLRDSSSNSVFRVCSSIDFQPGARIAAFSQKAEYEESLCYLTGEQASPDGLGMLMIAPNSVHFNEICLSSNRPERECPSRRYVFERHARKRLKLPSSDLKEFMTVNRTECEDKCLGEISFVCRSATFDSSQRVCSISRFTRRTHPELFEDEHNSDYLENTCLNAERRCDGLAVFVKEENKKLGGPFEAQVLYNTTLDECQATCVQAEKFFCRSVEYDEMTKECILSEEDSVSQKDDVIVSASPTHHFYDLVCLDNLIRTARGTEYPDNSVTSPLFSPGRRPDTAFQRYRNSRITVIESPQSEFSGRTLSECLDDCLRQPTFQCRSAAYSERERTCKLSRYNQKDGMRLVYDPDFDYYENLMHQTAGAGEAGGGAPAPAAGGVGGQAPWARPTTTGGGGSGGSGGDRDRYPPGSYGYGDDDGFPNDDDRRPLRPLPDDGYNDIYPARPDRYPPPSDRYPLGADRYPIGADRYPIGDDRYPAGPDRYPTDRYSPGVDRYPSSGWRPGSDQYPPDVYPPGRDKYPSGIYRNPVRGGSYPDPLAGDPYDYPLSNDVGGFRDRRPYYDPDRRAPGRYRPRYPAEYPSRYPSDQYPDDRYPTRGGWGGYSSRPAQYPDAYPGDADRNPTAADWGRYPYSWYPVGVNRDRLPAVGGRDPPVYSRYPTGGSSYPAGYGRGGLYGGYDNDRIPDRRPRPDRYEPDRPVYGGGGGGYRRPVERPGGYRGSYPPPGLDRPLVGGYGGGGGYGGYEPAAGPGPGAGVGAGAGFGSRCEEDTFRQVGRQRMQRRFVRRFTSANSLAHCQRECIEARDFVCRAFNYREAVGGAYGPASEPRDNCELSDRDTRELNAANPAHFDNTASEYDFYERALGRSADECLDVSQVCNEDGMEFTMRLPEGFFGRVYTYGFYDRCFVRGKGETVNVLRISGFPDCGTQRYGDTMTNIVVVQFSDNVQTSRDKRFNLTCLFRGPAEAVVTSNYIGAGSGSPIPIEYLPEESSLNSKVRLMILYQGRPTTTIAVGDPLTFRLEAQDGYNYATDIFATNVIARDPYSGRSVQLIDRTGCPVDSYVFPELDKGRSPDTLEARFNAFKIPESNFLVFEATVRTCRDGCQPAYCPGNPGRSDPSRPSFGRRRRDVNATAAGDAPDRDAANKTDADAGAAAAAGDKGANVFKVSYEEAEVDGYLEENVETPKHVRKMIEVFDNRNEMLEDSSAAPAVAAAGVCVSPHHYRALLTALVALLAVILALLVAALFIYRRYWKVIRKNLHAASTAPPPLRSVPPSAQRAARPPLFSASVLHKPFSLSGLGRSFAPEQCGPEGSAARLASAFDDGSEPIYTDPSLFERSRSLRSLHSLDIQPDERRA